MKYEPSMIPQFISQLESAKLESEIQSLCLDIKAAIVKRYPNENSRRRPMAEIRKAVREAFPAKGGKSSHEAAPFPWHFTDSGKGKIERWEHLAIKHLREDWNQKSAEQVDTQIKVEVKTEVESESAPLELLQAFGLSDEEMEVVRKAICASQQRFAIADTDVKEWLKFAILKHARAVNSLSDSLKADWESIPSRVLTTDKKYRTNPAACRELVSRAVRVVKQWNLDHPEQKWCITNKLISELSGVTVKATAKAVEGMDLESYNQGQGLTPAVNRLVKSAVGEPSEVMSLVKVTGIEGSERDYPQG